jgi:hypothetical protein
VQRPSNITVTFAAAFTVTTMSSIVLAADALSIRDLAPSNAMLVLGADDIRGTVDRMGPTALGRLWADPALAEDVKKFKEQLEKGLIEAATEAGIAREDVTWPSSAGLAVLADIDEELGLPSIEIIFFCDWAAEAEKAAKLCDAILENMKESAKAAGEEMKSDEIRGRRVLITPTAGGGDEAAGEGMDGEFEDEFGGFGAMPDIGPKQFVLASDKGRLFVASSTASMDMLLGRVDGDRTKSIGDETTFKDATELAGGTQDVYAVLSTEAAKPLLGALPQFMLVEPFVQRLFGDIKAWSFGFHAKDGVLESAAGIYVPGGKVGLLSLIDTATEPKAAPSIVPSDALSYGRMNVRFDKILPMLDEVIGGLPPEQGDMIKPQLDIYRPAMTAAFGAMGPEMHVWSIEAEAGAIEQPGPVFAIAMKNDKESAAAVSDLINLFPLGLQSRDFNGMTIMSDEFAPAAVGIGGGYMVIGEVKQVEQALRSVDAKGEAGLAGDAQYAASFTAMAKDPVVGMAWFNIARQMESSARMLGSVVDQLGGMAELDGEAVPGLDVGLDDVRGFYDLMKPEVMKRCFGDAVLDFKSTSKGLTTSYRMLPAAAK